MLRLPLTGSRRMRKGGSRSGFPPGLDLLSRPHMSTFITRGSLLAISDRALCANSTSGGHCGTNMTVTAGSAEPLNIGG
jgi:hypothetical protein